ncbi:MAG: MurR/RpiR family transcriptional regulator [Actinobacteria bacterium]|nr:MurR/RpiR family transcriptional regulator [Actinomycetota bacterium]
MNNYKKVKELNIKSRYNSLIKRRFPQEEKLYRFIVSNPSKIRYLGIKELSKKSGVSTATISRFCKKLDYKSFSEFKLSVITSPKIEEIYNFDVINIDDDIKKVIKKTFSAQILSLTETQNILDEKDLLKIVKLINNSNKVIFYGVGRSSSVAEDAAKKFMKLNINSNYFVDSHSIAVSSVNLSKKDLAFGISHSGRTIEIIKALENAKANSAKTICITNFIDSPLAEIADISIRTASSDAFSYSRAVSSLVAQIVIMDTLYVACALDIGQKGIEKIKISEEAFENLKIFNKQC